MVKFKRNLFIIAILLGFFSTVVHAQYFIPVNETIGQQVSDFTLKDINNQDFTLSEFRENKKTVLFFWATWCPNCGKMLKDLSASQNQLEEKGIKILTIDMEDTAKAVEKYLKKNKLDLPVVLDEEATLIEPYQIIGVPTFFFIDEKGIVRDVLHSWPDNLEEIFS